MKRHSADQIRNVVLLGHGGSGKTSLVEAILFRAGVTDRLGRVDDGTTVSDSSPDEVERRVSINASMLPCEWKQSKLNLLDTPGYADFIGEVIAGTRVADAAALALDATAGVEVQTERYWEMAKERGLPAIIVVNKLDKENADFDRAVGSATQVLGCRAVPIFLPIGQREQFRGVVDLLAQKAIIYSDGERSEEPVPENMRDAVAAARERMTEAAAEAEDELTEKYLEEGSLSNEDIVRGIRKATIAGSMVPAIPAVALNPAAADIIADSIAAYCPSPSDMPPVTCTDQKTGKEEKISASDGGPLVALVFKTMADPFAGRLTLFRTYSGTFHSDSTVLNATRNTKERIAQLFAPKGKAQEAVPTVAAGDMGVVSKLHETLTGDTLSDDGRPIVLQPLRFPEPSLCFAIHGKTKSDQDKVSAALHRLVEEDPTLQVSVEAQTHETLLSGLGDLHLEVSLAKLKRKFNVEVEMGTPRVPYRESIRTAAKAQGKYKKQTGGRGQYADVWVEFEPVERGAGFEFVDKVVGGAVPRNFIPSVEKGIREAVDRGVVAGYPMVDVRATLYDGSYHTVDSSDMAFKIAGSMALQSAVQQASPVLLEPVMDVEVIVPEAHLGDVIGALNGKRARILGTEPSGSTQAVRALVPQAEMFTYARELRSMTQGRGHYSVRFSHYEEVPDHIMQSIIAKAAQEKEKSG